MKKVNKVGVLVLSFILAPISMANEPPEKSEKVQEYLAEIRMHQDEIKRLRMLVHKEYSKNRSAEIEFCKSQSPEYQDSCLKPKPKHKESGSTEMKAKPSIKRDQNYESSASDDILKNFQNVLNNTDLEL